MSKKRLGVIETLLDDGVLIFEEDLNKIEDMLKSNPDLITDVIKVHEFARDNEAIVAEHIYPSRNNKLVYELATYSAKDVVFLSLGIDNLDIKSNDIIVSIAYPREEEMYESD
ncbi:hypothetical protein [uncultured virus]|uniref:Uncharacterized protein n=1 Tax=uncultured virus TaxID=340016 RepID=A0A5Q0TWE9_9VIRU|nr:hypothetical protein [uncultured virus]